ncbi:MAG TPA: dihydropteroate synthase, partial [Burkholderiaceae bacterium]|nr:dihydropteroate synthase [Burkholderiaceae bacterium]
RARVVDARIVLDPGFGFGKSLAHNLSLLASLAQVCVMSADGAQPLPLLAGLSRKSMLGSLTGREVKDRVAASVTAAVVAVQRGARIVRVHDVAPTVDALKVLAAVQSHDQAGAVHG